jgi:hypothetical protein
MIGEWLSPKLLLPPGFFSLRAAVAAAPVNGSLLIAGALPRVALRYKDIFISMQAWFEA